MRFVEIPLSGILDFTSTEEFKNSAVIPVTPQRARSQSINPRGSPGDIILILAYNEKDELVGFIGALPDRLSLSHGWRVAWNSGWWIDPIRGREAAMPLFYRFLDRWNKHVLFADLTPLTYEIVCKTGFFQGRIRMGTRGYLRMPLADILPQKNRVFRTLKWLFSATDFVFNLFWEFRLRIWKNRNQIDKKIEYQFISELDSSIISLIKQESTRELIRRGEEEFNWIHDYPWVIQGEPEPFTKRYSFTSHARRFEHHRVKIIESNQVKAFLIITLRDNHLKVPYLYYKTGSLSYVMDFLLHFMISSRVQYISVFRQDLADYLIKYRTPMIWKKRIARYTAVSKDLAGILPEVYQLQDGDGDSVFT
jgi:hypothetical protein